MEAQNKTIIVAFLVGIVAAFVIGIMLTDAVVTTYYAKQIDYARTAEQYLLDNTIKMCQQQNKQAILKGTQYDGQLLNYDVMCA